MKGFLKLALAAAALACLSGCGLTLVEGENVVVGEKVIVVTASPTDP